MLLLPVPRVPACVVDSYLLVKYMSGPKLTKIHYPSHFKIDAQKHGTDIYFKGDGTSNSIALTNVRVSFPKIVPVVPRGCPAMLSATRDHAGNAYGQLPLVWLLGCW